MKKLSIAVNLPDNGGSTFFGPLMAPSSKVPSADPYRNQRMYICASQDPLEVGQTLMAMLADLRMSDVPSIPGELDRDIGEITF